MRARLPMRVAAVASRADLVLEPEDDRVDHML